MLRQYYEEAAPVEFSLNGSGAPIKDRVFPKVSEAR